MSEERGALYLALWLPSLATDRLRLGDPGLAPGLPLATARSVGAGRFIAAVDPVAAAAGLTPGMTLASARALCPEVQVWPEDLAADAARLDALAAWARRYAPLVATAGGDRLMLDVTGCPHLFGGPAAMLATARREVSDLGHGVRAGMAAGSPSAAAALAVHGAVDAAPVTRRSDLSDDLAALPVAALRLAEPSVDGEALDGLRRVGLRRLRDLYGLPRAALATRFGPKSARALDRLLGRAAQPIDPRRPSAPYRIRLAFPDPIGLREDIDAGVARLIGRLVERLRADARGCRRLVLSVCRADGTGQRLSVGTARPENAPDRLTRLLVEKLDGIEPGFGIDCLILEAPVVEAFENDPLGDVLHGADAAGPAGPAGPVEGNDDTAWDGTALAALCDRLTNRLGEDAVFRLAPVETRLPDAAQTRRPPLPTRREARADWPPTPGCRPPRLLARPVPLTPLHAPKAGEPLLAFRLRGRRHAVRIAAGPERIAPDWWRRDAAWAAGTRDYWRVEDEAGQRLWIYRDGATSPAARTGTGPQSWFLHGIW